MPGQPPYSPLPPQPPGARCPGTPARQFAREGRAGRAPSPRQLKGRAQAVVIALPEAAELRYPPGREPRPLRSPARMWQPRPSPHRTVQPSRPGAAGRARALRCIGWQQGEQPRCDRGDDLLSPGGRATRGCRKAKEHQGVWEGDWWNQAQPSLRQKQPQPPEGTQGSRGSCTLLPPG